MYFNFSETNKDGTPKASYIIPFDKVRCIFSSKHIPDNMIVMYGSGDSDCGHMKMDEKTEKQLKAFINWLDKRYVLETTR